VSTEANLAARRWRDAVVALLAAVCLLLAPYILISPLSADVWVHFILRPLLGTSVAAARGAAALADPLTIVLPWIGAFLLAWPLLSSTSRSLVAGADSSARAKRWSGFLVVVLGACTASVSLVGAPGAIPVWPGWPYMSAAMTALFGALFVGRAFSLPRSQARFLRATSAAAGICTASYILLPLGILILAIWYCTLGISLARGRAGAST
jgi:hypothetical protein